MHARNALAEAVEIAGPDAWVLEPSPPAVDSPPFFADDPVTTGPRATGIHGAGPDRGPITSTSPRGARRRARRSARPAALSERSKHRTEVFIQPASNPR